MSLAGDVIAALRTALTSTNQARQQITAVRDQADDLILHIQAATHDSSHDLPGEALVRLQQAQIRLDEAVTEFDAGNAAVVAYIDTLGDEGGPPAPASTSPQTTPTAPAPPRGIEGFQPKRLSSTAANAIRRIGWPKDTYGKLKARGHLYNDDGVNMMGRTLRALPYGQTYDKPDLKQPWRSDPDFTTSWHIEGGAAAWMRDTQTRSATLYLNAPTCGSENRDPKRCYENIAKTLPQGATLTVWSVLENGEKRRVRFRGTGEAIT